MQLNPQNDNKVCHLLFLKAGFDKSNPYIKKNLLDLSVGA